MDGAAPCSEEEAPLPAPQRQVCLGESGPLAAVAAPGAGPRAGAGLPTARVRAAAHLPPPFAPPLLGRGEARASNPGGRWSRC